jgi:hypothetical protein
MASRLSAGLGRYSLELRSVPPGTLPELGQRLALSPPGERAYLSLRQVGR